MNRLVFSLPFYATMLRSALDAGFHFCSFSQQTLHGNAEDYTCLLRHDVDADMHAAFIMAQEEHRIGIRTTYFVMLRSPLYNIMSRSSVRLLQRILELGHWLGLHYDQGFLPDSHLSVTEWIQYEAETLEKMFHTDVTAISFHQPGATVLQGKVDTGKRINTYSPEHMSGIHYISDSNRIFNGALPQEIFTRRLFKKVQLLIHPLWWVYENEPTTESAWESALLTNFSQMQEQLLATERAYGPRREFRIVRTIDTSKKSAEELADD